MQTKERKEFTTKAKAILGNNTQWNWNKWLVNSVQWTSDDGTCRIANIQPAAYFMRWNARCPITMINDDRSALLEWLHTAAKIIRRRSATIRQANLVRMWGCVREQKRSHSFGIQFISISSFNFFSTIFSEFTTIYPSPLSLPFSPLCFITSCTPPACPLSRSFFPVASFALFRCSSKCTTIKFPLTFWTFFSLFDFPKFQFVFRRKKKEQKK